MIRDRQRLSRSEPDDDTTTRLVQPFRLLADRTKHVSRGPGGFDVTAPSSGRFRGNPCPHGGVAARAAARAARPDNRDQRRGSSRPVRLRQKPVPRRVRWIVQVLKGTSRSPGRSSIRQTPAPAICVTALTRDRTGRLGHALASCHQSINLAAAADQRINSVGRSGIAGCRLKRPLNRCGDIGLSSPDRVCSVDFARSFGQNRCGRRG
jgi:hypothetical protein